MNLQKMMKQAQDMQRKIGELQARLETEETEGSAGGGSVKIRMNGKNQMLKVTIDQSLLNPNEKDMLEDMLIAAHNDARGKIDSNFSSQMGQITGGLDLPPGMKLPF